ncbi:LOG family protein [Alteromonas gracilis]
MARHVPEIETLDDLHARLSAGARDLHGWHLQSLDLSEVDLTEVSVSGAVLLGARFAPGQEEDLRRRGALVFPALPHLPFDPYRAALYTPDELYDAPYASSCDALVYGWASERRTLDRTLAVALHDHSIDDALRDHLVGLSPAGVMGGHALERGTSGYADAARLGRLLAERHTVATGGGPGAMEAANLGAWLSSYDAQVLEAELEHLATVPSFRPDIDAWVRSAQEVRSRRPDGASSLGVPTWFYGHEPPNLFATEIAKYFTNAVREDVLIRLCHAGIVFLPGAAGTVQEVFQDACENYYADPADRAPMVLLGVEHWTRTLPAWPLLRTLLHEHDQVHLVDDVEAAAELLP